MGKHKKDRTPFMLKLVRWGFPKLEAYSPALAHRYFLRIFFTPLKYPVHEKEDKATSYAKLFTLTAADQTVQGYVWGEEGPYVLLVHGWAGRATQFRRFVKPLLRAGFRVIGFDGPAHGRSTGRRTNLFEFRETINRIYEMHGEPSAIIAHSFGGVAVLFAAMHGLPVRKLVNIASPSIGDEVIRTYLKAVNGSWSTGLFFKDYIKRTQGKTFDEFSSLHFVQNLPQPIDMMVVQDENDREVEMPHAEALIEAYPRARLLRTQKLGHTRILKDDDVIRKIVAFITRHEEQPLNNS